MSEIPDAEPLNGEITEWTWLENDDLDALAKTGEGTPEPEIVHATPYPFAGRQAALAPAFPHPPVHLMSGRPFEILDWADRAYGKPWIRASDQAAQVYGLRVGASSLPVDDRVLIGTTISGEFALIHVTEIGQLLS